ncbi:GIY-YIG nuclease family protein [Xenorhabdus eapokensis]|uniref:GIY-YIG nuclease family protein n=1 Tax=Xenorhabdus eapokensis TaxID=1873482 RepID=UPI002446BE72|nr:GIY-YIG nuclease family protein [Xenorhabdus eapokensis]
MTVSHWYIYLIRTRDGSLYTGITNNIACRFKQHAAGKGAKYLKGKNPLTLVYQSQVGNKSVALKMEYRVKKLSKQQKERLVIDQPLCIITYLTSINSSKRFLTQVMTTGEQNKQDK